MQWEEGGWLEEVSWAGPPPLLVPGLGGRDQKNLWPVSIQVRFLKKCVGVGTVKAGQGEAFHYDLIYASGNILH